MELTYKDFPRLKEMMEGDFFIRDEIEKNYCPAFIGHAIKGYHPREDIENLCKCDLSSGNFFYCPKHDKKSECWQEVNEEGLI